MGRWATFVSQVSETVASNQGLLLVAASQFFFALMNLMVKKLNSLDPPVPALELVAVRMSITWTFCIIYMLVTKVSDPFIGPKGVRTLLLFRGFSGFVGLFGIYYSLQYLSLSDATVLTFLAPFTTAIAGAIFLNESFTRREALAGTFSLLGVVLIARPTFIFGSVALPIEPDIDNGRDIEKGTPTDRLVAVGVALVGVLGATGAYTSLRAIGKQAHVLHALVSFSTICVIAATIGMVGLRMPVIIPTRWEFLLFLAIIGIFGFMAQALLTMGLQRETAGRGTMGVYIQIIFATILERIFFNSTPSVLSVIGTVIIMASAIYIALTKANTNKRGPIALEGPEDAAMEEGLLESVDSEGIAK
jgi:drug/metabolite transporter (DMT)-like permease